MAWGGTLMGGNGMEWDGMDRWMDGWIGRQINPSDKKGGLVLGGWVDGGIEPWMEGC